MSRILRRLARLRRSESAPAARTPRDLRARLWLAPLEEREVPATFSVTNTGDNGGVNPTVGAGTGTLRQAIVDANATATVTDDIVFALGSGVQTISLSAALPTLVSPTNFINSTGAANLILTRSTGTFSLLTQGSGASTVTVTGMTLTGASASTGGGIYMSSAGALTVNDSVISNNTTSGNGGGIYIAGTGNLTVNNSTISGNTSAAKGGGIYFVNGGGLLVNNSTISGNTANTTSTTYAGGGISFYGTISSLGFRILNTTIHGNTSGTGPGGGIAFRALSGTATIVNSTITGNNTGGTIGGAGISRTSGTGTIVLSNSIVAANTLTGSAPAATRDVLNSTGTLTVGNSLIGVADGLTGVAGANGNLTGTAASPLDPQLGALGANGGPTQTRVPNAGSPVLNAGSNALIPTGTPNDQRGIGYGRVYSATGTATVDIGAVELQPVGIPSAAGSSPTVTTAGGTSQTVTVVYSDLTGTNNGILFSSLGAGDITVTGPGGTFTATPTFVSATPSGNGTPRTATYTFTPPGGTWDSGDNGTYTISVMANQVSDLDGNFIPAGAVGTFDIAVPLVLTVTNLNDSGAGSLRDAITKVVASASDDTITFQAGLTGTITLLSALPTIANGSLTITNPGGSGTVTVARSGAAAAFSVLSIGSAPTVSVTGLTITGGSGTNGGGINNTANANVNLTDVVVTGNAATGTTATTNGGGGVFNGGTGTLTLTNSRVAGNTALSGGGIFNLGTAAVILVDSAVANNTSTSSHGGGIRMQGAGNLTVQGTSLSGNTSTLRGGGVYFYSGGGLLVLNSSITGNTANSTDNVYSGGGVSFYGTVTGFGLNIRNSTIANNTAAGSGGGVAVAATFTGSLGVQNSTITGNTANAGSGGGISLASTSATAASLVISNSVVADNVNATSADVRVAATGGPLTANNSLIRSTTGLTITGSGNLAAGTDPQLGALGNNGGLTLSRLPNAGSPLLNAGSNALVPAGVTTDQRGPGGVRVYSASGTSTVDIGAIEVQPLPPVVSGVGPNLTFTENDPVITLASALAIADLDNSSLASATVKITAGLDSANDVLDFTPVGAITGTYNAATGTLQLTGVDTLANYQLALRSVTFISNGDSPTPGNRTIAFTATDSPTGNVSTAVTKIVTVVAVNDVPTLGGLGGTISTPDNTSVSPFSTVTVADPDAVNVTVTVSFTAANGTLTANAGGTVSAGGFTYIGSPGAAQTALRGLVFAPTVNQAAFGASITTTFTLSVTDGATPTPGTATDATTQVVATNVNDAPSFTFITPDLTVLEDDGPHSFPVIDSFDPGSPSESGQAVLAYEVEVLSHPELFSVAPTIDTAGFLSFDTPLDAAGFSQLRIRVRDNGGTANGGVDVSAWQNFIINVLGVNDAPTFVAADPPAAPEDGGPQTVTGWAGGFDPGPANESGQSLVGYETELLTNPGLFSVAPAVDAAGNLTYTPAANANGTATFRVRVQDDGGTVPASPVGSIDLSAWQTFTITVTPVNDAPSFSIPAPAVAGVAEDAALQTFLGFATSISKGPADEAGQTAAFTVSVTGATNGLTFAVAPAIAPDGTLTFQAAPDANGTATLSVTLTDSGGTALGGVNTSAPQTFTITINPANDGPVNTPLTNSAVAIGSTTLLTGLSVTEPIDNVPAGTAGYSTTVSVPAGKGTFGGTGFTAGVGTESITVTGTLAAVNAALATLTYTPVANDPSVTITVFSADGGNTGGGSLYDLDTFVLVVKVRPVITLSASPTTFTEDGGAVAVDPGLTVTDSDSTELSRAVVRVSGGFLPAEDVLTYTGTLPAGVTADTSVAGEITFSGTAPVGDYVTLLRSVTYANTNQFPDVTTRTVTFQVTDEVATSLLSDPVARPVAVDDLNDAPVNALAVGLPTVAEEGTATLPGVSVSDVDLGTNPIKVTLSTTAGTLAVTGAGVTITGSGSAAVTVEGPAAAVNLALGSLAFTGATDFVGSAIIQVVSDDQGATGGPARTDTDSFTVNVFPVNDAPSFTPGPNITVSEDSGAASYPSWATNILVGPADESAQTVTFLVSSNLPGVFTAAPAIDAAGNLTFAVRADAVGTATVTVRAQDNGGTAFGGVNTSAPRTFTITLAPVNDTPSFTRGDDISVTEDSGPRTFAGWARGISRGPIDEINQAVQFLVSTDDPGLFTAGGQPAVDANGTLTFTPAADVNGSTTVRVRIKDNGGGPADTSAEQTFTLTVISLNDPPQFIVTQAAITAGPSTAPVTLPNFVTNIKTGPPDEAAQTVQFEVTNNGEVLFSAQPAVSPDGTLTFTPAAFRSGVATVTVRLRDSGGDTFGVDVTPPVQTFTITVNGSNTAPTFTAGASQTVFEDAGPQSVPGWATNLSAGLPGESGQTLTFLVTTNQPGLFAAPPAVSPTGTLTYTPAADAVGTASVTVRLMDSGGTDFGGVDTSAPQSFTITLSPVNDAPRFTVPGGPVASDPANGPRTVTNFATGIAAGPADEAGQAPSLTFLVSTNNNALFTALPTINPTTGTLTFTPAAGANGTATVTVRLQDTGGTANGGVNVSAPQTFSIVVAAGAQNSPPAAAADAITVAANSAPTAVPVLANDSTAPDAGETLTVTAVGSAAHGLATLTGGAVFYAPAAGFSGTDTFTYTVTDGSLTATATVTVTVTPPVDPTPKPTPTPPATVVRDLIAVADQTGPRVQVVNAATGAVVADIIAFPGFAGGVNATVADVTGDGTPDVIVGAGAGGGPVVKVFDGKTLAELTAFHAFLPSLRGGVHVAAADVNGDGVPDLVLGAGAGGGPHVKVVDGTRLNLRDADNLPAPGALIGSFFAYADNFLGGVSVAAADVDGDGKAEVVTGAGPGGSPHVKVYAGGTLKEILSVIPYNENFRGGVNVGAGDLDGDGLAEIITGAGAGGGPHVGIYDGKTGASKGQFFAFPPTDFSGVTVAVRPLSAGGTTLVAALGSGELKSIANGEIDDLLDGAILGGIAVG